MRIAARIALLFLAVLLVAGLLWMLASSTTSLSEVGVGKPAPATQGVDADGVAFQLSDYRGKVVLLDFWADW